MSTPNPTITTGEAVQDQRVELVTLVLSKLIKVGFYGDEAVTGLTVEPRDEVGVTSLWVTHEGSQGAVRLRFRVDANANIWNAQDQEMTGAVSSLAVAFGFLTGEISAPVIRSTPQS